MNSRDRRNDAAARRREQLRDFGARISDDDELRGCGRTIAKGGTGSSGEILSLKTSCKRNWLCPRCGHVASKKLARKLRSWMRSWTAKGGALAFLTLTQSHCLNDALAALWDRLLEAWKALVNGSAWKAGRRTYGVRAYLRITEVEFCLEAGWNPHFHVILFLDRELHEVELEGLWGPVAKSFVGGISRSGGRAAIARQQLLPVEPGTEGRLANYLSKGTTLRTDRCLYPMDILDRLESTGEGAELWKELTEATLATRRRQLIPPARIETLFPAPHHILLSREVTLLTDNPQMRDAFTQ